MMKNKNKQTEETPYNMAVIFYIALNNLIEAKDNAYINNDNFGWYKGLSAIYRKIIFNLSNKEIDKFDTKFKQAQSLLQGTMTKHDQLNQCNTFGLMMALDEIDKDITILMGNKHMIFPRISSKGLDYLNKKYNLTDKKSGGKEHAEN